MRFGAPLLESYATPKQWCDILCRRRYRAAYCPVTDEASDVEIAAYADAARRADIVIAEVGAWSNLLTAAGEIDMQALEKNIRQLALAERIGARCCVNISGSRGATWDGPHRENLTQATFQTIVRAVRTIIDEVKPAHASYALEPMPWAYPNSADSYLALRKAIDREAFGVHMDLVNVTNSPEKLYNTAGLATEWVGKLGAHIRSCHLKDIAISDQLTVHLSEVTCGQGEFDFHALFRELSTLDPDLPVMTEHLATQAQYDQAEAFLRRVACSVGATL